MARNKNNLIKLLTVALTVLLSVFVFTLPKTQVAAEDVSTVAVFSLTKGASVRLPSEVDEIVDGEEKRYKGLRFSTQVNDLWFDENPAEEYVFGTLIFPEKNGAVNTQWTEYENVDELYAVRIVADTQTVKANGGYTAAIVYDHATVKKLAISSGMLEEDDVQIDEKTNMLLEGLYSLRLTAVSYVKKDGVITYTDSYTTSITEVSVRLLSNPDWVDKVSEYVTLSETVDDGYVLVENGTVGNYVATDVKEVFLNGESVEYSLDGETLVIPSLVAAQVGQECEITVLDNSGNAVLINAVTADVAITSDVEFVSIFDAGDYSDSTTYPVNNSKYYVLVNDIDLSNQVIDNTADIGSIVLSGTFNGLGHTVSNAIVDMTKSSGKATQGIFGSITGTIKNVGFTNVKGTASSDVGLTAPFAKGLSGTLENVYIGLNPYNYNNRGPISTYSATAVMKNVVIDFPQPDGFVFDDATYETVAKSTSTYAYGYGALGYEIGSINSSNLENVYVISPMPVNYAFGSGGSSYYDSSSLTTDYFFYGENETDVWFNYSCFANNGITNPTVENTKGEKGSSKTVVLDGIRRYNTLAEMTADKTTENLSNIEKFLSLNGWVRGSNGDLLWNTQKETVIVDETVDYDAYSGELVTTVFNSADIVKVTVGNEELTEENGGLVLSSGVYSIRAKTSTSDTESGVPYMDTFNNSSNTLLMTVETKDKIYKFNSVNYYTMIISDAAELKTALDITYTSTDTHNFGFYVMDADVDMTGVTFSYSGLSTSTFGVSQINQNTEFGFAGQFNGRGHSISNVANGAVDKGLFANFVMGSASYPKAQVTVENLAVLNWTDNGTAVLGMYVSDHNYSATATPVFENIYVTYNQNAVVKGLIMDITAAKITMKNIVVYNPGNPYVTNAAIYGSENVGNAIWQNMNFYAEGTVFGKLRFYENTAQTNISNVISIGKYPIAYQSATISNWSNVISKVYSTYFTATDNGDGTYTHTPKVTGWSYGTPAFITGEMYVGYAANETKGTVLKITGLKPAFAEYAKTSNGSTLAGYYCATCYGTFDNETGTCSCGATLTQASDLWNVMGVYTYGVTDLTTYTNPTATGDATKGNGEIVFSGINRYETTSAMKTAYTQDNSIYESFLGEEGNDMWGVNSSGELVWKNSVTKDISVKVNDQDVDGSVDIKVGESAAVEVYNGTTQIEVTSMTTSSDAVTLVNNVAFAEKPGTAILTFTYSVNSVEFTETVTVNVGHDYGELISGVAPTCTVDGTVTHYECSCCNKYFDENFNELSTIVIVASHDYSDWIYGGNGAHYKVCKNDNTHVIMETCSGTEATCTEGPVCSTCNAVYSDALGHTGGVATCEEWGTCTRCQTDYIEPLGHAYTEQNTNRNYRISAATCVDKAVYYYACTNCGGTDANFTFEYGDALGHTGGVATCEGWGNCTRCQTNYIEPLGHAYTEQIISEDYFISAATCEGKAVYYYACANCGGTSDEYVFEYGDVLGHTGGTADCTNQAICERCNKSYGELKNHVYIKTADETEHWEQCRGCSDVINRATHDFDDGTVTAEPSCTTLGETTYACACGYEKYEDIAMLEHVLGAFTDEVSATCETTGVKAHYQCSTCSQYFDADEDLIRDITIPKAHVFVTYNQPIAPTCEVSGRIGFYHCDVCGKFFEFDKVTELSESDIEVPATGHDENTDFSTGRCPCGEVYADVLELFPEYFEFISVGLKLPENADLDANGTATYTWGYKLNRFYGDLPGAPVHIQIPTEYNGEKVYGIADYVFDTTSDAGSCTPGVGSHANCEIGKCSVYYYYNSDLERSSPTTGNSAAVPIQSVVIPEGILFIGTSAFGSTALREVVIPDSVIGGNSTRKATVSEDAVLNKDIYEYPLYNVFGGCNLLEKVVIGSGVEIIGPYTFYGLSMLRDVEFRVTEVDNGDGTTTLKGVKEIRPRAFGQNSTFIDPTLPDQERGKIVLPETLVSIPEGSIAYTDTTSETTMQIRLFKLFTSDMTYYLNITEEEYNALVIPAKERDGKGNIINTEDQAQTTYGYTEGWQGNSILYFKGEWEYVDGEPVAYEEITEKDVSYDYSDGTYLITNDGAIVGLTDEGKALTTLEIPSSINGVTITRIAPNAFKDSAATSVTLPETVTTLDACAFRRMKSLQSVVATSNLTSVGKDIFRDTSSVTSLVILSQNENVSDIVIAGTNRISSICEKLGAFTVSISETNYVLTTKTTTYIIDDNKFIYTTDNVLVGYLGTATELEIYDFIVEIGESVFEGRNVTKVVLPEGLKKIGNNAFRNSDIISIDVPAGVTEIGEGAFAHTNIKEFTLPSGVTKISANAFAGCKLLRTFNWNDSVTEIDSGAFSGCEKLKQAIIPSSVKRIGDSAFLGCERLEKVYLPLSVESIGSYAFSDCIGIIYFEYEGTRADWNLMSVSHKWTYGSVDFDVTYANGVGGSLDIQDEMTLIINESGLVSHNLTGILFWSSDDENVVTVDENGCVRAIDAGTATITVQKGREYGYCEVTVIYGDYLPELNVENSFQEGDLLEVGKTYNLYADIMFNGKHFDDFTATCVSSDSSVATAIYNQNAKAFVISALTTGKVTVTVSANWRNYAGDLYTMTKSYTVDVIGNVQFLVNGDLPLDMSVNANASGNYVDFVPTVVVDGVTYTPSVSLDYLNGADASCAVYDSVNARLVGYKVSSTKVMLRYNVNGIKLGADFIFNVTPNTVEMQEELMFSADDGLVMVENASGEYEAISLSEYLGETVNTATSRGYNLFVDGDGAILYVDYSRVEFLYTKIEVVTDYAKYVIPVKVAKRYIDTPEDFLEVLNVSANVADDGIFTEGSFALVNNLDMTGYTAYNFVNNNGTTADAISAARTKDVFSGLFDGQGYTVSNLTINMYKAYCQNQGLFGLINVDSTIRNVAFTNFTGYSAMIDVGLTSPFGSYLNGTMENVYIEVSEDNCNNRGAINKLGATAVLNNVVMAFKVGATFDYATVSQDGTGDSAWGYGSLAQSISTSATFNNVYVVSTLPVYYSTGGGGADRYDMASLTTDYFLYGENETEFWFNHTANEGKSFGEVAVDFTSGTASKARYITNLRRYDSIVDLSADSSDVNATRIQTLVDTGCWTVVDGVLTWAN